MRKITIFDTSNNLPFDIESDATTYGEIKADVVRGSSYKVILGATKQTLEADAAVLPDGDFTIFLFPQKVKSGLYADDFEENPGGVLEAIEALSRENAQRQIALVAKLDAIYSAIINGSPVAAAPSTKNAELSAQAKKLASEIGFGGSGW